MNNKENDWYSLLYPSQQTMTAGVVFNSNVFETLLDERWHSFKDPSPTGLLLDFPGWRALDDDEKDKRNHSNMNQQEDFTGININHNTV